MIYKRPERFQGNVPKYLAIRNFILILLTVLSVAAGIFIYKYMTANRPDSTVIKYTAEKEIDDEPLNDPGKNGNETGGGGGGGGESDVKHTEVFVFSEPDPTSLVYNIFIYDSATGEKKQLTGTRDCLHILKSDHKINPKFSFDGNTIYFFSDNWISSTNLKGEKFDTFIQAGKANFSVSGSNIVFIDISNNIKLYDLKMKKSISLFYGYSFHHYDFPMISKDGKKFYYVLKSEGGQNKIYENDMPNVPYPNYQIIYSGYTPIIGLELSPDDKFLLITFGKDFFKILDIKLQKIIQTIFSDKKALVIGATWSGDGKSIYWIRDSPYKNISKLNIENVKKDEDMISEVIVPNFSGFFVSLKPSKSLNGADGGGGGAGDEAKLDPETFIYASSPYIYFYDPSTYTEIQLTGTDQDPDYNLSFQDSYPKYSPNGTKIAFCRSKGSLFDKHFIHTMNTDGSNNVELVQVGNCHNFCFSNNSKLVYYVDQNNLISYINIEIGVIYKVTFYSNFPIHFPLYVEEPETRSKFVYFFLFNYNGYYLNRLSLKNNITEKCVPDLFTTDLESFSLSPDSSMILFSTSNPGETFIFDLKSKTLTQNPVGKYVKMSSVFWSNDGESVYFHLDDPSNILVKYGSDKINDKDDMVVVLDKLPVIRGISLTPLTRNEILFYSQYRGSKKVIISHNLRTGIKTELTQNYEDTSPKISPDGKTIVFCRRELPNSNIFYLYQMDSDGKNLNRICNVSSKNCDFNLSNDGKRIIYTNNKGIFSIGLEGGFSENLKATGNRPVMSVNEKHLYFADGKSLYKKSLTITDASIQFVHYFNGIIQDFRLSPDGKFSSVLYNNIVTIISLDKVPPNTFIPILDGKCPIEDAIWSLDNKWLYLRRGLPKQDLIKISTSDFDITKAEVVYRKLITDSITQITLIN